MNDNYENFLIREMNQPENPEGELDVTESPGWGEDDDIGGNVIPDRIQANEDRYKEQQVARRNKWVKGIVTALHTDTRNRS